MSSDQKLKNYSVLLILISLISLPANAQDVTPTSNGNFTEIKKGQLSPFDGWCFDTRAMAALQASLEFAKQRCELKIQKSLQGAQAAFDMQIDNLKLRIDTIQQENEAIFKIKNKEIQDLEAAALKRPNDYVHWWAIGGFAVGALVTVVSALAIGASM